MTSSTMLLVGIAMVALGLCGALLALLHRPRKEAPDVLGEQLRHYGASALAADTEPGPAGFSQQATELASRALSGSAGFEARLAARLEGADMAFKPSEWLPVHAAIALVTSVVALLLSGGSIFGLLLGMFVGALGPWLYLGIKQSRRTRAFQTQLPETLQLMAGSLQAGLSLAQSVDTIVREGSEPIVSEFRRVVVEARLGVELEDALDGVAERMESKDFTWVVMAIRIQRSVGGNLAELLLKVAGTLREREYIRRHVRALSAEGRLSVYILGGLPPLFLAYLSVSNWSYVSVLFTTPIGWVMLGVIVLLLVSGVFWMSKVIKVAA